MKSLRLLIALLAPFAAQAAEPEPADSLPPLFYVIALSSEVVTLDSLGLTPGVIGDANRKSTLLHPIACMSGECRRIVDPPGSNDRNWLRALLAQEPTQAGRLAYMYVTFDGYYFSVVADFSEMRLDGSGRPKYGPKSVVIYSDICPRAEYADGMPGRRRDQPQMSGVPHSYQAQMLEWSGCTNERLLKVLGQSFERIAGFWQAWLTSASEISAKLANQDKLPLAFDVVAKDAVACKPWQGDYRVVKDLGDHLWLAFPDNKTQPNTYINMVPRCVSQ
jgi:hypothetical protein